MTAPAKDIESARLTDFLDGAMDDEGREDLESLLTNPELRAEMESARVGRDLLQNLGTKPTPTNFLRKVQRRVRRKSGGRHFHPAQQPFGFGLSIEVFVVVAVAVMAACWMILDIGRQSLEYDVFIPSKFESSSATLPGEPKGTSSAPGTESPSPVLPGPSPAPIVAPPSVRPPTTPPQSP